MNHIFKRTQGHDLSLAFWDVFCKTSLPHECNCEGTVGTDRELGMPSDMMTPEPRGPLAQEFPHTIIM